MNLQIYYSNQKNEYIEKKIYDLVESYSGQIINEFSFENGAFSSVVHFKNNEQERNFKQDVLIAAKPIGIKIEFGGAINNI